VGIKEGREGKGKERRKREGREMREGRKWKGKLRFNRRFQKSTPVELPQVFQDYKDKYLFGSADDNTLNDIDNSAVFV